MNALAERGLEGIYKPTSLELPDDVTLDELRQILAAVGIMARAHQWWVGDALVHVENHHGADAMAQLADELGLEPHTLTNWRWVADSVEASRRREELTWSHHAEVARLKPAEQKRALAKAVKDGWTVRQLRDHVALQHPQANLDTPPADDHDVDENRRLERARLELETAMDGDEHQRATWVMDYGFWLLDVATRAIR